MHSTQSFMNISHDSNVDNSVANSSVNDIDNAAHLIVVGGTSGIGLALALQHQQLGWQVSVIGHNIDKIADINHHHPTIRTYYCDLTDFNQRQILLDSLSAICFQRLIYSAGSYTSERVHKLNQEDSDLMLAINLQAFEHVFMWASDQLKQHIRHNWQASTLDSHLLSSSKLYSQPSLVCIASIAGMIDYPYASLYAKSKRAMIVSANAYRCALAPYNIQVTCIASGYIDTQALRHLNNGDASHKPFIISTQTAIKHIMQAINDDVELAIFPRPMRYITRVLNKLPKPVLNRLLYRKLEKTL